MQTNESKEWRKLVQPLVTALVGLVAAATLYVQKGNADEINGKYEQLNGRMLVMEANVVELKDIKAEVKDLSASVNQLIGILSTKVKGK